MSISAIATCESGAPFVGAFVRAEDGEAGFASWSTKTREDVGYLHFVLHAHVPYRIGIGCGGDPQHWRGDFVTSKTSHSNIIIVCNDAKLQGQRIFGRCKIAVT